MAAVNDSDAPSFTDPAAGVTVGVNDTSVIESLALVIITVTDVLPLRTCTWNVSVPSVLRSLIGVTENEPVPLSIHPVLPLTVNDPLTALKSALTDVLFNTVQ